MLNQAGKAPFENKTAEDLTKLYFKIDPDHNGVALNEWMKYYSEKYPPAGDSCARCEAIKKFKK